MAGKGRIENLRPPWKPGESGNPDGRPKKRPISDRYNSLAETPLPEKRRLELDLPQGTTYGDALTTGQFDAAIDGNCRAAREIREAIEGRTNEASEAVQFRTANIEEVMAKLFGRRNEVPTDASSVPNRSQDDETGSK
jgi:hypothetical protein